MPLQPLLPNLVFKSGPISPVSGPNENYVGERVDNL